MTTIQRFAKRRFAVLLSLIVLFGAAGVSAQTNLAQGKAISASSNTQTYVAANANDGSLTTYWEGGANAYPATLTVDLGADSSLSSVVVKLNPDPAWGTRTQTFSVLGKTAAASSYTTLKTSAQYTFAQGTNSVPVTVSGSARYVQLSFTQNSGATGAQVAEFQVLGTQTVAQTPFGGSNRSIAANAVIQVEDYDNGGQGVAYNDTTSGNSGSYTSRGDNVDMETSGDTGGTPNVGWIVDGEWLEYTVNATAGTYNIVARVASAGSGTIGDLQVLLDGVSLGTIQVGSTGGWQSYVDATINNVAISGGNNKVLQLKAVNGGDFNLNYIKFTTGSTPSPSPTPTPTPTATPTPTPTPTATPTPTPTPTATPTPTPTSSPSGSPDLVVTAIGWNNSVVGTEVTFTATVKNQGTGVSAAGTITGVQFQIDGTLVSWSDNTTTPIQPGQSAVLTATGGPAAKASWTATLGAHTVLAWVDDVNRIAESNESNNQLSASLTVTTGPAPDLQVTVVSWSPASPIETDGITVNATIKNNGVAASVASTVTVSVGGVASGSTAAPALAVGATANVSFSIGTRSAGQYAVSVTVDPSNVIQESNDGNNTFSSTLTVSPAPGPDLQVLSITPSNTNPAAGAAVSFTVAVNNRGTTAVAAGTTTRVVVGSTTLNQTATPAIAAGATVTVTIPGTWSAVAGSSNIVATADAANGIAETNESNNSATLTIMSGRGAAMPYIRYESETANLIGGGAVLKSSPNFDRTQLATQASNQKYVELPSNGAFVQWTVNQSNAAGVTMRFTMPDTSDGMGQNGSLDCYVNGVKVATINLTSYFMWQYFSGGGAPSDTPNGQTGAFGFDEVHWKVPVALNAGDTIKIQSTGGLVYGVDFLEIETVPAAIAQPANSVSVTDFGAASGAADNLTAFNSAVNAAVAQGKTLYIPAGNWNLSSMWVIGSVANPINNITITGAGIWHTNIKFTNPNISGGGISFRVSGKLDFGHMYLNSNLRSRYHEGAIYKAFMDNFGVNSKVHNIWEEHFECGFWVADYAYNPAKVATGLVIENSRIRNNLADGVNFCQGTSNSTVQNCDIRNNGDDGLAVWPNNFQGAPMAVNNTFTHNTLEFMWRAGAIAFYGGSGHQATFNYIKDTFMSSGIHANTTFPGYHFENNTGITISDTTIVNSGTSYDAWGGEFGAVDLQASATSIKNFTFSNIDVVNAQRDGFAFGFAGGFSGIQLTDCTVNGSGLDGITASKFSEQHLGAAVYTYGAGAATFTNFQFSNAAGGKVFNRGGFVLTFN